MSGAVTITIEQTGEDTQVFVGKDLDSAVKWVNERCVANSVKLVGQAGPESVNFSRGANVVGKAKVYKDVPIGEVAYGNQNMTWGNQDIAYGGKNG